MRSGRKQRAPLSNTNSCPQCKQCPCHIAYAGQRAGPARCIWLDRDADEMTPTKFGNIANLGYPGIIHF
jgi:hypothetical protein